RNTLAGTNTDESGLFEIASEVPAGAVLKVAAPAGWKIDADTLELDSTPTQELVFVAHAVPTGTVRGQVVDELTLEPVPYLPIGVGSEVEAERLETDGSGSFVTQARYSRGPI